MRRLPHDDGRYFAASTFFFGPYFQRFEYYLVGAASLVTAIAMTWVYAHLPPAATTTPAPVDDAELAM